MDLLEREQQWQQMSNVIKSVLAGQGAIVLVAGEAGSLSRFGRRRVFCGGPAIHMNPIQNLSLNFFKCLP